MNVQEAAGNEQTGTDGMYCRFRVSDVKMSATVPVVNIDSENYMLRGISPVPEQRSRLNLSKAQTTSDMDLNMNMDKFVLRETGSSLATMSTAGNNANITNGTNADEAGLSAASSCARILSFHSMLCTCCVSCCCMCGSFCSLDCYACFHRLCTEFAANYACQNDSSTTNHSGPATYDIEKVSPL